MIELSSYEYMYLLLHIFLSIVRLLKFTLLHFSVAFITNSRKQNIYFFCTRIDQSACGYYLN